MKVGDLPEELLGLLKFGTPLLNTLQHFDQFAPAREVFRAS